MADSESFTSKKFDGTFTEQLIDAAVVGQKNPKTLYRIAFVAGTIAIILLLVGADLTRETPVLLRDAKLERNVYQTPTDRLTRWLTWAPHPLLETMPEIPAGISGEFVPRPADTSTDLSWVMQNTSRFPSPQLSMFPSGSETGLTINSSAFDCNLITNSLRKAISADGVRYWFMVSPYRIFYSADAGQTCDLVASTLPRIDEFPERARRPRNVGRTPEFEFLTIALSSQRNGDEPEFIDAIVIDESFDIANLPKDSTLGEHVVFATAAADGALVERPILDSKEAVDFRLAPLNHKQLLEGDILSIPHVNGEDILMQSHGFVEKSNVKSEVITFRPIPAYFETTVDDVIAPTLGTRNDNSASNVSHFMLLNLVNSAHAQDLGAETIQQTIGNQTIPIAEPDANAVNLSSDTIELETSLNALGLGTFENILFAALILDEPVDDTLSLGNRLFLTQGRDTIIQKRLDLDILPNEPQTTLTDTWLRDVSVSGDGTQIWLSTTPFGKVGTVHRPTIYFSNDGGNSFNLLDERATPPPAMWWVFGFVAPFAVLSFGTVTRGWRIRDRSGDNDGHSNTAESVLDDSPIGLTGKDVLGLRRLALGIANVIYNTGTSPPLTFGITGSWGSGKSSLMTMLKEDLRSRSGRVIWFNGWHHQSEDHALAAILEAIRNKAVPPIWSGSGLLFRMRLLWERRRGAINFLVPYLAFVIGFTIFYHASGLSAAIDNWTINVAKIDDVISPLAALSVPAFVAIWRIAKPFKFSPMNLLNRTTALTRIVSLEDKLSVRYNFREQFADVTRVLSDMGTDLTIIIDDLDRCTPEHVRMILDAINFLTSAGPCYIVLGFDKERVLELLKRQYEDETDEENIAERYMQKIINVELAVPEFDEIMADELIEAITKDADGQDDEALTEEEQAYLKTFKERKKRLIYSNIFDRLLGFVFISIIAGLLSWVIISTAVTWKIIDENFDAKKEAEVSESQENGNNENVPVETANKVDGSLSIEPVQNIPEAVKVAPQDTIKFIPSLPRNVETAEPGSTLLTWIFMGAIFGLFVLLFVFDLFRQLQRRLDSVTDSHTLTDALKAWIPYIQADEPTPRNLKQFVNYTRLMKECLPVNTSVPLNEKQIVACSAIKRLLENQPQQIDDNSEDDPFSGLKSKYPSIEFKVLLSSVHRKAWSSFNKYV